MQCWFFLEDYKEKIKQNSVVESTSEDSPVMDPRNIYFSVRVPELARNEKIFLTGNIPNLGEWTYENLVPLEKQSDDEGQGSLWSVSIETSCKGPIKYRYVSALVFSSTLIIYKWETQITPRTHLESENVVVDLFGEYNNETKLTRGWLTTQTMIQFKFSHSPLKLKSRLAMRQMNIKVTPIKLSLNYENQNATEDSISGDTMDVEIPSGVYIEVATLDDTGTGCTNKVQEQFGRNYKEKDILLINVMAPYPEELAYLIDLYSYSTRVTTDDPPCHIGYTYVLPNMFLSSQGSLHLPVTCHVKHRPLGSVRFEYMIVRPLTEKLCTMEVSYSKHWDQAWTGLEVGHRGLGASFKTKGGNSIRENTIASLKKAAASGADLLEFDVQLSKDMIPVIYHDYHVCISMKKKREIAHTEMLELPVKDLTLEQLQKLKVYHLVEGRNHETLFFDEELEEHQPFPTLEEIMKIIDIHVGFNIELKWSMELEDGTFELNNPFDMNTYVDKILEVVLKNAGERRIVFACFNAEICAMIQLKQNKYPVVFLTLGISSKYPAYRDTRSLSIKAATQNAISASFLGLSVHTEDLLRDPNQVKMVKDAGLVIFCWGDDNNNKETIKMLKEMGLHAVVYDRLDEYSTKEVKESVFLVEARESQRELMHLAIMPGSSEPSLHPLGPRPKIDTSRRDKYQTASTATSLESLSADRKSLSTIVSQEVIEDISKEVQLKQRPNTFLGLFRTSVDDDKPPAKSRKSRDKC